MYFSTRGGGVIGVRGDSFSLHFGNHQWRIASSHPESSSHVWVAFLPLMAPGIGLTPGRWSVGIYEVWPELTGCVILSRLINLSGFSFSPAEWGKWLRWLLGSLPGVKFWFRDWTFTTSKEIDLTGMLRVSEVREEMPLCLNESGISFLTTIVRTYLTWGFPGSFTYVGCHSLGRW